MAEAACEGSIEKMKACLQLGVTINGTVTGIVPHWTPLMWASYHGKEDAVAWLIEQKADVRWRTLNRPYNSALDIANRFEHKDCASLLRIAMARNPAAPSLIFFRAASCGYHELLQRCLDDGTNIHSVDDNGWTALMHAVHANRPTTLVWLLDRKADPAIHTTKPAFGFDVKTSAMDIALKQTSRHCVDILTFISNIAPAPPAPEAPRPDAKSEPSTKVPSSSTPSQPCTDVALSVEKCIDVALFLTSLSG
jgi:ankyrin repeat protein